MKNTSPRPSPTLGEGENSIIIYTDGSSLGNPGPGGFGCVIVFKEINKVVELGGSARETTNNKMELTAIVRALEYVKDYIPHRSLATSFRIGSGTGSDLGGVQIQIVIHTDSSYAINGITKWMFGWQNNNWITSTKTPVLNSDIWKQLILLKSYFKNLSFEHVRGHSGIWGNERCDEIATSYASGEKPILFNGTISNYDTRILTKEISTIPSKSGSSSSKKSGKAYSYVALVNGKIQTFKDWESCKAVVHGRSSKYKKALSKAEEDALIKEWSK